jgi:plastocyanin
VAEIGSSSVVAAVVVGVPVAVALLFVLWAVPKRVSIIQPVGSLAVVALLGLGLWAAFEASPPAATSTTSMAAGGPQFSPVGPSPGATGQPSPPSPSPSPSPQCQPSSSTSLTVTAPMGASVNGFGETCLAAPAGKDFTVTLKNEEAGTMHNWVLFRDKTATDRLGGATSPTDAITGPAETTYQVKGLPAGTYFFHCDIHPNVMTGTFVVS